MFVSFERTASKQETRIYISYQTSLPFSVWTVLDAIDRL